MSGVVLLVAGCGTGPETMPSTGVDELIVPSPTPDAADFVDEVDNPWWPLASGASWTYRDGAGRELVRRVEPEPRQVGGVNAIGVTTLARPETWGDESLPPPQTNWYAQDRRRNVWLVAGTLADGSVWEAGADGAGAGLVVSGVPRVGDGYVRRDAPSLPAQRVRVLEVDGTTPVAGVASEGGGAPGVTTYETTTLEVTTAGADEGAPGRPLLEVTETWVLARGLGPVRIDSPTLTWELVAAELS